ncbi:MAG: lytic transglycosylase domain-containing protein [Thermodesulfobacteriota bacterium]
MFKALYNNIKFSFFGIIKISIFVVFFGLAGFLVLKTDNVSGLNTASIKGFLNGSDNITLLNSNFSSSSEWSQDLENLSIEDITPQEAEIFLFILKLSDSINPTDARKLAKLIVEECSKNDLDPYLILAVIQIESDFTPKAVSSRGAIGLMQVMPKTGEYVAKDLGISYKGHKSLYDPFVNVKLGIHYISYLEERFDSTESALAAYNYGPTKFANSKTLANTTPKYVKKVLKFKNFLEEESILLAKRS